MQIEEVSDEGWSAIGAKYNDLFNSEESKYSHDEKVSRYDDVFDAVLKSLSSLGKIEVDGKIAYPSGTKRRLLGRLRSRAKREQAYENVLFSMSRWVDVSREITIVSKTDIATNIKAMEIMEDLLPSLDRHFQVVFNLFVRHEDIITCNFYLCTESCGRHTAYCSTEGLVSKVIPPDRLARNGNSTA